MNTIFLILLILTLLEGVIFSDEALGTIATEWGLEKAKNQKEKRENG